MFVYYDMSLYPDTICELNMVYNNTNKIQIQNSTQKTNTNLTFYIDIIYNSRASLSEL